MSTQGSQSNPIVSFSETPGIRMAFTGLHFPTVSDTLRAIPGLPQFPSHIPAGPETKAIGSDSPFFNAGVNIDDVYVSYGAKTTDTGTLRIVKRRVGRTVAQAVTDDVRVIDDFPLNHEVNRTYSANVRGASNRLLPGESLVVLFVGNGLNDVVDVVVTIRYSTIVS
jgi:hypothetical protein